MSQLDTDAEGVRFLYLEMVKSEELKFYELRLTGPTTLRLEWGRIGEKGWSREKDWQFDSERECLDEMNYRYSKTISHGYKRVRGGRAFGFGAKLVNQANVNRLRAAAAAERLIGSKAVPEWTAEEVCAWVRSLGDDYGALQERFERAGVDGRVLLQLDEAALGELGVDARVQRMKLVGEIRVLQERTFGGAAAGAAVVEAPGALGRLPPDVARIDPSELEFVRVLGQGSFGVAELARWRGSNVVVKRLKGLSESAVREMHNEAKLLARFSRHPHIVSFVGVCEEPGGSVTLVSEYAPNGSAEEVLCERGMFTGPEHWARVLQICVDVAAALVHLHHEPVVHRDLAARNILLDSSFRGKLADFGMSRLIDVEERATGGGGGAEGGADAAPAFVAATTKSTVGPLRSMAPESLAKRVYSPASDVFSYGVLLWEVFARMTPYTDLEEQPSLIDIASRVMGGQLRPTRLSPDVCPPEVADLMEECWKQEARDRISTRDLHARMSEILALYSGPRDDGAAAVAATADPSAHTYGQYFAADGSHDLVSPPADGEASEYAGAADVGQ